jgi:hypothetical protein
MKYFYVSNGIKISNKTLNNYNLTVYKNCRTTTNPNKLSFTFIELQIFKCLIHNSSVYGFRKFIYTCTFIYIN